MDDASRDDRVELAVDLAKVVLPKALACRRTRIDTEDVVPGAPRTVILKAKGYKDKTVVLDGTKKKLSVKLDRVPGSSTGNTGTPRGSAASMMLLKRAAMRSR